MTLFSRKNLWRVSPLLIAALFWVTGYIFSYYEPLADLLCDRYNGASCMYAVGFPLLVFSQWFLGIGIVLLLARAEVLKRWSIFAILFVPLAVIGLANTSPTQFLYDRLSMSDIFGALFFTITIFWIVIHTIILWRKEKKVI